VRRRTTVRAVALLSAGSLVIHQFRYAIGYGDSAASALAAHGHGYLSVTTPAVLVLVLFALASALTRVARAGSSRSEQTSASLVSLWLMASVALAAIFATQETLEGAGALAGGGWIGLALAMPAGLLVAFALRGAAVAEVRTLSLPQILSVRAVELSARPPSLHIHIDSVRLGARAPPVSSFAN
jgi:hypothetical protein